MKAWVKAVLTSLGKRGQLKKLSLLEIGLDGKHLKSNARGGIGDKAIVLVLAYLSQLGLSLLPSKTRRDEAAQGRTLIMGLSQISQKLLRSINVLDSKNLCTDFGKISPWRMAFCTTFAVLVS